MRACRARVQATGTQPKEQCVSGAIGLRIWLTCVGAAAGASVWWLSHLGLDLLQTERAYLALFACGFVFFVVLLTLSGPVSPLRAIVPAVGLAAVLGGLFYWASLRHADVSPFFDLGYAPMAFFMALLIAIPFAGATLKGRPFHYELLFDLTWNTVVKSIAAVLFTGLFWLLVYLSDALLDLVDLTIISDLMEIETVPFVLSGAVFGLAMAIVNELDDAISPHLVLRLLRILVPVVLVVIAVFVSVLPVRGITGLVGDLSPAMVLLSAAIGAIVLITAAVDRDNEAAACARWMALSQRALALLVPVLGGLAFYAIWLRVESYGWTPERLMALTLAALALAYGVLYAVAVLRGARWRGSVRIVNVWMAVASFALCLLWLSPLFHPEDISARDQARLMARADTLDPTALRAMGRAWGKAGQNALDDLERARPDWSETIEEARAGTLIGGTATSQAEQNKTTRADLAKAIRLVGPDLAEDAVLEPQALEQIPPYVLDPIHTACTNRERLRCVMVLTDGPQDGSALLFWPNTASAEMSHFSWSEGRLGQSPDSQALVLGVPRGQSLPLSVLAALQRGTPEVGQTNIPVLRIGETEIFVNN